MLRINNIKLGISEDKSELYNCVQRQLGCRVRNLKIVKQSIDARRKNDIKYVFTIDVSVDDEEKVLRRCADKGIQRVCEKGYEYKSRNGCGERPIIVGAGPAGLFCALVLARNGYKPIILERGKCVEERIKDTERFCNERILDENSNIQFGEGGAGTFSDGKLTTGIKDVRIGCVISDFIQFGAPDEIAYLAKPHVGTDNLRRIVVNMRREIMRLGGEIRFSSRVTDIIEENGRIKGVKVCDNASEYEIEAQAAVLCTGHSARDTVKMLYNHGVKMEPKAFSVGVRIEHLREHINESSYGEAAAFLPAADYKLFTHLKNGRGVYTFCMCPGGEVINASSEHGGLVTNGMSNFARGAENSNSALLVSITPADYGNKVFGGIELQRRIEAAAFEACGGSYVMPAVTVGDFLKNKVSTQFGIVKPSVRTGTGFADFNDIMPEFVIQSLREGIVKFDKLLKGFSMPEAVLTAPETRSSSPVTILRDKETFETNISGLFCAGEGGGHAGGITSSAVDGIKAAEAVGRFFEKY